jgi:ribosomal protein L37E
MPYIDCDRCGLTNFTAAYWSSIEQCTRCGSPLPRPRRAIDALAEHPRTPGTRRLNRASPYGRQGALVAAALRSTRARP